MKLLLVEDDAKTVAILRKGLVEHGYSVESAATGPEGYPKAAAGGCDLVVLDVMLPGKDGWSILCDLRSAGVTTPVLILTARDAVKDRVKGLELGADDYLVKPFAFAELLARVRTLLRRGPARSPSAFRVADLEVDFLRHNAPARLDNRPDAEGVRPPRPPRSATGDGEPDLPALRPVTPPHSPLSP